MRTHRGGTMRVAYDQYGDEVTLADVEDRGESDIDRIVAERRREVAAAEARGEVYVDAWTADHHARTLTAATRGAATLHRAEPVEGRPGFATLIYRVDGPTGPTEVDGWETLVRDGVLWARRVVQVDPWAA